MKDVSVQACKLKFSLRELISCFCCIQISHVALKADSQGGNGTSTGSELSQLKFEFTGLILSDVERGEVRTFPFPSFCCYILKAKVCLFLKAGQALEGGRSAARVSETKAGEKRAEVGRRVDRDFFSFVPPFGSNFPCCCMGEGCGISSRWLYLHISYMEFCLSYHSTNEEIEVCSLMITVALRNAITPSLTREGRTH